MEKAKRSHRTAGKSAASSERRSRAPGRMRTRWAVLGATALILAGGAAFYIAIHMPAAEFAGEAVKAAPTASYVGSESCAGCHRAEAELWRTSQHKHAMDHATDKTVLGDFS